MSENETGVEGQPIPQEPKRAGYKDVHTAENAPMKDRVDDLDEGIRALTPEEIEQGFLSVMVGNSKKDYERAKRLIGNWMAISGAEIALLNEEIDKETFDTYKGKWVKFAEEHYPDHRPDDLKVLAEKTYSFIRDVQDELKVRSKAITEEDITNTSNRGDGFKTGDIMGRKPNNNSENFTLSQRMLRGALKSKGDALNFDVLLRNSYVALTFSKPDRMTMGALISDINKTIGGYVRQLNHNSGIIARVAIMKAIWNFLHKRIINSSVSDVGNFSELAKVIRINDFDTLCIALIEAYNPGGVNLHLSCLAGTCTWGEHKLVDPKLLVRHRPSLETDEDLAIYGNIYNGTKTYTMAETLAMSSAQTYGLDTTRIYNEAGDVAFGIANPTLAQAFQCFDYFVGGINPRIQEIRSTVFDPVKAEDEINLTLSELGSTEYLHWVDEYVLIPPKDSDQKEEIFKRSEVEDQLEFIKGVRDVLVNDNHLNRELIRFVLNKTPLMSKVIVGIRNYDCPACGTNTELSQDPEFKLERAKGYVPIDAPMSFFILTQLALTRELANQVRTRQEATSN